MCFKTDSGGSSQAGQEISHLYANKASISPSFSMADRGIGKLTSDSITQGDQSTMYLHQEVKDPKTFLVSPTVETSSKGTQEILNQAFSASAAINATMGKAGHIPLADSWELEKEKLKHMNEYHKKKEAIAEKYDKEVAKLTQKYREKTEAEAEKIRKELEKQHKLDIEYREKLLEDAMKRQKEELDLEAKYAGLELDRQRKAAFDALEEGRGNLDVEVHLNTAAGTTTDSIKIVEQTTQANQHS